MKKQKTAPETPKDQDHLEVYPEKKQVSAFPERRFIKTNRFLVIIALINLACILAGASIFIYSAQHVGVNAQNKRGLLLYQLDREEKKLKQAEYRIKRVFATRLIMEDYLNKYITERNAFHGTLDEFSRRFNEKGFVLRSSSGALREQIEKDFKLLQNETLNRGRERDVHIYNLHPYSGDLWTAVIESFDFPKRDGPAVCDCIDNSEKCLKCKYENTLLRQRKRIWIRAIFTPKTVKLWNGWIRGKNGLTKEEKKEEILTTKYDNPFGIKVQGYYEGYMPKDPENTIWDLPPELR